MAGWMKAAVAALAICWCAASATAGDDHGLGEARAVEFQGMSVHYESAGEGDTTILCVHGWASDGRVFAGQFAGLADRARLIAIDLPGHGFSDAPQVEYTVDLFAGAIASVMDAEGVESAVLMGHSNGVPVIKTFERAHPERTRAMVCIDGAMLRTFTREQAEPWLAMLRSPQYKDMASNALTAMLQNKFDDETKAELESMMLSTPQHVMVSAMEATLADEIWEPDPIDCPVLMVQAPNPMWHAEYENSVREFVPQLDYRLMPGVTHFLMMEEPEEFNAMVVAFLDESGC